MISKLYLAFLKRHDPIRYACKIGVHLGEGCRLIDVSFGSEPWLIKLGNRVSISNTQFITHDGGVWVLRPRHPKIDCCAPIVIGDNVFIGSGTIILPGVTVGNNVVIGAGSIVASDIPSDSIVAGVPARRIRSIEEYEIRILPRCDLTKGIPRDTLRRLHQVKFPWLWAHKENAE